MGTVVRLRIRPSYQPTAALDCLRIPGCLEKNASSANPPASTSTEAEIDNPVTIPALRRGFMRLNTALKDTQWNQREFHKAQKSLSQTQNDLSQTQQDFEARLQRWLYDLNISKSEFCKYFYKRGAPLLVMVGAVPRLNRLLYLLLLNSSVSQNTTL
ncbi:hypothetical protein GE09DRAFT_1107063, partial [Coniochaeta sp. 2T2.1]